MKRLLWSLAKRLFRSELLRDVDAVLLAAYERRLIDTLALHEMDHAFKYGHGIIRQRATYAGETKGVFFGGQVAVLLLLALAAAPALADGPVHVCVTGGGAVVLSGEASASVTPSAQISVRGPIVFGGTRDGKGKTPLGFGAELELTGLPGETVATSKIESIKALELAVSIERVIGKLDGADPVTTALYIESGFATRLPHDPAPLDHYPRWLAGGVRLRQADHYFAAALGTDQRLDGTYQLAALISGQVGVPTPMKGVQVLLRGSAILGLSPPGYAGAPAGGRRDVVRIGVVLGR